MTVRELIAKLNIVDGDLNIVMCVNTEEMGIGYSHLIFDDVYIDLGWEPSGQCSIESSTLVGKLFQWVDSLSGEIEV